MKEKLTEDQKKECLDLFHQRAKEKYDMLDSLIRCDDHIAEIGVHVEWIQACMETIISCTLTGIILNSDKDFKERERMLKRAEENVNSSLKGMFAQALKDIWGYYGDKKE
jgi:hypothetical protein